MQQASLVPSRHDQLSSACFPGRPLIERIAAPGTALALLFAIGGLQAVVILLLPHWEIAYPVVVLSAALAGVLAAPLIWLTRGILHSGARQLVLGLGTVATSVAVFGCGAEQSTVSASYVYVLVMLYAAAYFRPIATVLQLALVGVLYAAVLTFHSQPAFPAQWVQLMSVLSVTALIVGGFAMRVRNAAAAMNFQAFHDPLTGLANRALFLDRLDRALVPSAAQTESVAVLFMDLDDFKQVNDSLGHQIGDQLLVAVAERLDAVTRVGDTLARIGGDEFALLVSAVPTLSSTEDLASRLARTLDEPFMLGGTELSTSISIGIAASRPGRDSSAELLGDADLAMYLAKQNGKARFETVLPGMQDAALEHLSLLTDLRRALLGGEFEVFYQPIVGLDKGTPVGVEALLRWHHPRRGLVPPGEFIGVAESAGLIVSIGRWVLTEACRQAQAWRLAGTTDGDFSVSVNLSPRQLAEPTIVEDTVRALQDSGLPATALILEITESGVMSNFGTGLTRLQALKDLGVRLAIDDYGTGYSSLSRLRQLPVDIVKIDKSFVDGVASSSGDRALVRSVIDVTRALGIVSVAEGVELPEQYVALKALGCDAVQGYLFARPEHGTDIGRTLLRLAAMDPDGFTAPPDDLPLAFAVGSLVPDVQPTGRGDRS